MRLARCQESLPLPLSGSDLCKRISCGNQPPRVAFPHLPSLPRVPDLVNPDAWLSRVKGQHLVRRVNRQGFVKVDLYPYYISSKLAGQRVTLSIQATEQSLQVVYPQEYRRSLPLKGLHQRALPYQEYLELMQREASTQQRLLAMGSGKDALTEGPPHTMSGSLPSHEVGKSYPHPVGQVGPLRPGSCFLDHCRT